MKQLYSILLCLLSVVVFSQTANSYRYIIVPAKFHFQKTENQYNLNALTKMVFEKQGYEVFFDNETFPAELLENRCQGLYADMIESHTLFMTKLKLELKDCKNQTVFVSEEGTSREKEYSKSYVQAFRGAGKSVASLKSIPKPIESVPVVKVENPETKVENLNAQLFAQPITNGYQLVDSTPKVVLRIFKTSQDNFFIVSKENIEGVVFKKDNLWFFEYYLNGKLISEKLDVKF